MSRTIKFAKAGGPEVLDFVEVQVPAPGPNEVRIKVKAIGINRAEAMWRSRTQSPVGSQESRRTDFCPYQHEVISPIETWTSATRLLCRGSGRVMSADLTGSSMKMDIGPTFSRRRLALGFVVVLAFPVAPVFAGREHRAREDAAKKFLGSIYQRYLGKSSAAATGVPLTDAQSVRGYFTFALASLILEDRAAATKQGESPALGTDPFIGRPEWDVSDLSVDVKDTAGFKTVGTVTFINFGKPERVVLELLRSGTEWRIADIVWDSGSLRGLYRRKAAYEREAVR